MQSTTSSDPVPTPLTMWAVLSMVCETGGINTRHQGQTVDGMWSDQAFWGPAPGQRGGGFEEVGGHCPGEDQELWGFKVCGGQMDV